MKKEDDRKLAADGLPVEGLVGRPEFRRYFDISEAQRRRLEAAKLLPAPDVWFGRTPRHDVRSMRDAMDAFRGSGARLIGEREASADPQPAPGKKRRGRPRVYKAGRKALKAFRSGVPMTP